MKKITKSCKAQFRKLQRKKGQIVSASFRDCRFLSRMSNSCVTKMAALKTEARMLNNVLHHDSVYSPIN